MPRLQPVTGRQVEQGAAAHVAGLGEVAGRQQGAGLLGAGVAEVGAGADVLQLEQRQSERRKG